MNQKSPRGPAPSLPSPERYDQFELGAILALIVVFLGLFIWLTSLPDQQLYQYLTFALVSTLVLSGMLKAVGVYKSAKVALGGSVVIFGVFFYLTTGLLDAHDKLKGQLQEYIRKFTETDKELTVLRTALDRVINRDIVISTYATDGAHQQCEMFVNYYDHDDNPKVARRVGINRHVIKWSDFDQTLGISFQVDQSCVPLPRADPLHQPITVKIDYLSFNFENLGRVDKFDPVSTVLQAYLQTPQ